MPVASASSQGDPLTGDPDMRISQPAHKVKTPARPIIAGRQPSGRRPKTVAFGNSGRDTGTAINTRRVVPSPCSHPLSAWTVRLAAMARAQQLASLVMAFVGGCGTMQQVHRRNDYRAQQAGPLFPHA
jgi:hypothetical protein